MVHDKHKRVCRPVCPPLFCLYFIRFKILFKKIDKNLVLCIAWYYFFTNFAVYS